MQGIETIFNFLVQHWILTSGLVVILLLMLLNEMRFLSMGMTRLDVQQLVGRLNHENAVVIDIRSAERFQIGHILGSINIPQAELSQRIAQLNKYKSKPIILVCATGADSPKMSKILKQHGFTELYYLSGGMDAWRTQNMPLAKKN